MIIRNKLNTLKTKFILIACAIIIKSTTAFAFSTETKSIGTVNFGEVPTFDTLQWVQTNIINNKQNFIGRQFSELLNTLPIPLKSYYTIDNENIVNSCTALGVSFLPLFESMPDNYPSGMFSVTLIIVWQTPIPMDQCDAIAETSKLNWTNSETQFYGNRIVADVLLVDFTR